MRAYIVRSDIHEDWEVAAFDLLSLVGNDPTCVWLWLLVQVNEVNIMKFAWQTGIYADLSPLGTVQYDNHAYASLFTLHWNDFQLLPGLPDRPHSASTVLRKVFSKGPIRVPSLENELHWMGYQQWNCSLSFICGLSIATFAFWSWVTVLCDLFEVVLGQCTPMFAGKPWSAWITVWVSFHVVSTHRKD